MIDGRYYFYWRVKSDLRTYENITKNATDQEDDYITGCLTDYLYFPYQRSKRNHFGLFTKIRESILILF